MTDAAGIAFEPASFRDPAGRVFYEGDLVYRMLAPDGLRNFEAAIAAHLLEDLTRTGSIPPTELTHAEFPGNVLPEGARVIRQPRLRPVTYSYEWPFGMLQAAALLTLRVLRQCLNRGFILKDGSSFNIVFEGTTPRFVDVVSIEPYREGQIWFGYAQFCRSFLAPLLLASRRDVPFQPLLRGYLGEIPLDVASRLLGGREWLSPSILFHIHLQARLNRYASPATVPGRPLPLLPLPALMRQITRLERLVAELRPKSAPTVWSEYVNTCTYTREAQDHKRALVRTRLEASRPRTVVDLGCNTGDYSALAADTGALVLAVDADPGAGETLYRRFNGSGSVAPIVADLANPTPAMGWAQRERRSLLERLHGDWLLALAVVHHLRITAGVPLADIFELLLDVSPEGLIEWVDRRDPMVQAMLAGRADVFHDYHWDAFVRLLAERATIVSVEDLNDTRKLCHYRRGVIPA